MDDNSLINWDKYRDTKVSLKLYGTSRQALYGDNQTPKPFFLEFTAAYKW